MSFPLVARRSECWFLVNIDFDNVNLYDALVLLICGFFTKFVAEIGHG